jgi:AraC-like DNA-binding protein
MIIITTRISTVMGLICLLQIWLFKTVIMIYKAINTYNNVSYGYCENVSGGSFSITDKTHQQYISEVVSYIDQNFNEDISLDEISRHAYLSKYHFSRIFKKHTSYSPYQYLIAVRLEHSRLLLRTSNYPITEIADRCGFKRLDYFSSVFKRKFMCSPSQYREDHSFN